MLLTQPYEAHLLIKKQILLTDLGMQNTQVYSFLTLAHASAPLMFDFI